MTIVPSFLERIEGGVLGLLIGDAVGVPYEGVPPEALPSKDKFELVPPPGFTRQASQCPPGAWSEEGAQALCVLVSVLENGRLDPKDLARRLLDWQKTGYLAVNSLPVDIGSQLGAALSQLSLGVPPLSAGLSGECNNGNGSLIRALPLALALPHVGDDELAEAAHEQSRLTHRHHRSMVSCALLALWTRRELEGEPRAWIRAVETLRRLYRSRRSFSVVLEREVLLGGAANGGRYVVDSLCSARAASRQLTFEAGIRAAVAFGFDTDATACLTGGILGVRLGARVIPRRWRSGLAGAEIVEPVLKQLRSVAATEDTARSAEEARRAAFRYGIGYRRTDSITTHPTSMLETSGVRLRHG